MKIADFTRNRPSDISFWELHLRDILFVIITASTVWLGTIVAVAVGYYALVEAGVLSDSSATFVVVLAGLVVFGRLLSKYVVDLGRKRTIRRDAKAKQARTDGGSDQPDDEIDQPDDDPMFE